MNRIIVKKELLPEIKNVQNFINGIQLSRILSSLRYNLVIYEIIDKEDNVTLNIKLNNFLNHAALLCEGIRKLKELESKLKELKSYQQNLDEIQRIFTELKNKNSFLSNVLCRVRNKIVFHFDKCITNEIFEEVVNECIREKRDIIFASGKTEQVKDMTFDLADNIDINYILKFVNGKTESNEDKFKSMVQDLLKLSESFSGILEDLVAELIQDYCEVEEEKST
jgi:hypothetical protein